MKKIILLITLLFAFITPSFGVEELNVVRVGISNSSFSTFEHSEVNLHFIDNSNILDMYSGAEISLQSDADIFIEYKNGEFTVIANDKKILKNVQGPLTITSMDKIGITGIKRHGDPAYYRGMIELKGINSSKFNIINVLDMQTYLKGVVPNEMPVSFGLEALKAQAVSARNYANRPNTVYNNYDVCDSVACQVYYGANSETPISNKAVDETLGIYALYNNDIILALYSSTASGITENYFDTFGKGIEDKPYLKSVSDTEKLKRMNEESFFKTNPPSFDMKSPRYRWEKEFEREYLEELLSKNLVEQSKAGNVFPQFTTSDKIKDLEEIKIIKKGASNKALEIQIKTKSKTYTVSGELPIRRTFKDNGQILSSANFIIEKISKKEFKKEQKEIQETKDNKKEAIFQNEENENTKETKEHGILGKNLPYAFKFYGAGFGHGVGLSQYGAGFLSGFGVPYENILKHYYTGITLGTVPKEVKYNNIDLNYAQKFYYSTKTPKISKANKDELSKTDLKEEVENLIHKKNQKVYLVIENENKVSKLQFSINNYSFDPELDGFKKKNLKTDITQYLTEGVNTIVFAPLQEADKRKKVKFYVVTGEENDR